MLRIDSNDVTIHLDEQMYNGLQGVDELTIKRGEENDASQDDETVLQVQTNDGV